MRIFLSIPLLLAWIVPANAMNFYVSGNKILAVGEIFPGDVEKLSSALATAPLREDTDTPSVTVSFHSPGGNLLEGIRIGMAIRVVGVPTLVERGNSCMSACAIAFLGGTATGVSSDGISRTIELGARLGYHGFSSGSSKVTLINEALDTARLVNALILEFALRMGGAELAFVAQLLNTPPSTMEFIDTPNELAALGISLDGPPPKPPKGWPVTACRNAISKLVSRLDYLGVSGRTAATADPMPEIETFRRMMLDDKYPSESGTKPVRDAILKLPASDALDLMSGQPIGADQQKVGAWRVRLDRGAGFYFDACYAITDFTSIRTIVIDGVSHTAITEVGDTLMGYPPDQPLW